MVKRIVIAGNRDYTDYEEAKASINHCLEQLDTADTIMLLSGACRGTDRMGERFAKEHGWSIQYYPAQWRKYGRAAGPLRNKAMVEACDAVICFWDGKSKGTASLIQCAKKAKKPLFVNYVEV